MATNIIVETNRVRVEGPNDKFVAPRASFLVYQDEIGQVVIAERGTSRQVVERNPTDVSVGGAAATSWTDLLAKLETAGFTTTPTGAGGGGGSTDITTLAKEAKQDTEIARLEAIRDNIGLQNAAAADSDTGTFSLIALFKRALGYFASLVNSSRDGEPITTTNITANASNAFSIETAPFRTIVIQVTGTFTGTIEAQVSNDNATWVPVAGSAVGGVASDVTTMTAAGIVQFPAGARYFRFRSTAWTSGTAVVTAWQRAEPMGRRNVQVTGGVTLSGATNSVQGPAAHDATLSGNPFRIAIRALTSLYTSVASGDVADVPGTLDGRPVFKPYAIPQQNRSINVSLTGTTATPLLAAAGTGLGNYVTFLWMINTGASITDFILLDGATERHRYPLPPNVPVPVPYPTEPQISANTALNGNLSVASTVRVTGTAYVGPA